jgi:DNA-binding Lrp family transcriptional regulator
MVETDDIVKLDAKDKRVLYELDCDSKQSFSSLAKKVGLSKEVVNYRVKNLVKVGVIRKFITLINFSKFGYLAYRVYIRFHELDVSKEQELIEFLEKHQNVMWYISIAGRWDLEILILARNFVHFNEILIQIFDKYGAHLRNNVVSMSTYNYQFRRRYLIGKSESHDVPAYGGEPVQLPLDSTDFKILKIISQDARIKTADIAKQLKLVPNAIKYRINRLRKEGVIQGYRLFLDIDKIGYEWYKTLITLRDISQQKQNQVLTYCKFIPNMLYFVQCFGQWDIEVEVNVKSNAEFRNIWVDLRNKFSENMLDFETLLVYKEHKLNYFPFEVEKIIKEKAKK